MELLENRSVASTTVEACAALMMETVPAVMRAIRTEMRRHRPSDLSVPQFRALAFIRRHPRTSLSEVAEHLGLTLSATSTLIDNLVARALISRATNPKNRRRVNLTLTSDGQAAFTAAQSNTQTRLVELLGSLSAAERDVVAEAMQSLRPIFSSEEATGTDSTTR